MDAISNNSDFIAQNWWFVPLKTGERAKAPIGAEWQNNPLPLTEVLALLGKTHKGSVVGGYGVICGPDSNGLLMLDLDGESAHKLADEWGELPTTWSVTSFRPGRKQLAYQVPKEFWEAIKSTTYPTGVTGDDDKPEQVELRWKGCQSVFYGRNPISRREYQWSYPTGEPATAPVWLIEKMLVEANPKPAPKPVKGVALVASDIPLTNLISKKNRARLSGNLDMGRNDAGAAIARDLLGTARYLDSIGQRYSGNPKEIFDDWCRAVALDSDVPKGQPAVIWKSAEKGNPEASLTAEMIANCIEAWERKHGAAQREATRRESGAIVHEHDESKALDREEREKLRILGDEFDTSAKVVPIRKGVETALTLDQTTTKIRELLAQPLSKAAVQKEKIQLRAQTVIPEREFNDLWSVLQEEMCLEDDRDDVKGEVEKLLQISQYDLPLKGILPPNLAKPMTQVSDWLGVNPSAMLLTLLSASASLAELGTTLELQQATGFKAKPILWTGIVAESGGTKTPLQQTVLKPLFEMQGEADHDFAEALEEWEAFSKAHKNDDTPIPPKPTPREYFTIDSTLEATNLIQASQPTRGFLGVYDELSRLIGSQNQYRAGKGADKESLLSARNGGAVKVNRASGKRISLQQTLFSITGNTQIDTLRGMMGDFSDSMGMWARFLWCFLATKPARYIDADASVFQSLKSTIAQCYGRIEAFTPREYTMSPGAKELYVPWFNQLDDLRLGDTKQAMRSVYAKSKETTGEIALVLHLIEAAALNQEPAECISARTMKAAINVMKFSIGQVKLIQSMGDEAKGDLSPTLAKVVDLLNRKGEVTASQLKVAIYQLRTQTPAAIRQTIFCEVEKLGYGVVAGSGNKAKLVKAGSTVDQELRTVEKTSTVDQLSESTTSRGAQQSTVDQELRTVEKSQLSESTTTTGFDTSTVEKLRNFDSSKTESSNQDRENSMHREPPPLVEAQSETDIGESSTFSTESGESLTQQTVETVEKTSTVFSTESGESLTQQTVEKRSTESQLSQQFLNSSTKLRRSAEPKVDDDLDERYKIAW